MNMYKESLDKLHRLALYKHALEDRRVIEMCREYVKNLNNLIECATPKKPIMIADKGFDADVSSHLCCPNCKQPIINVWNNSEYKPKYCHYCSQTINWKGDTK